MTNTPSFKRDVTPYEIHKYLKEVHNVEVAPQRIYRDRQDGRLNAYKSTTTKKWMVKIEDASNYVSKILAGGSKKENPW